MSLLLFNPGATTVTEIVIYFVNLLVFLHRNQIFVRNPGKSEVWMPALQAGGTLNNYPLSHNLHLPLTNWSKISIPPSHFQFPLYIKKKITLPLKDIHLLSVFASEKF